MTQKDEARQKRTNSEKSQNGFEGRRIYLGSIPLSLHCVSENEPGGEGAELV